MSTKETAPRPLRNKIIAALCGLLLLFLISEVTLSLAHHLFVWSQRAESAKAISMSNDEIRILVLGESTSAVAGIGKSDLLVQRTSYPTQLERKLNSESKDRRYVVINRSSMGGDSARAVANIDDYMQRYRPHVVLAMMGMKDQGGVSEEQGASAFGFRTVRFLRLLFQDLSEKQTALDLHLDDEAVRIPASFSRQIDRGIYFLNAHSPAERLSNEDFKHFELSAKNILYRQYTGDLETAVRLSLEVVERFDAGHALLASTYAMQGNSEQSESVLREAIARFPSDTAYHAQLGSLLRDRNRDHEAIKVLKEGLTQTPKNPLLYYELALTYKAAGQYREGMKLMNDFLDDRELIDEIRKHEHPRFPHGTGFNRAIVRNCRLLRGEFHYHLKEFEEAEKRLLSFLKVSYEYDAIELLSQIYRQKGLPQKERDLRLRFAQRYPRLGEFYEFAKSLTRDGRRNEVAELMRTAVRTLPVTSESYHKLYEAVRGEGARLMYMQYPTFSLDLMLPFVPEEAKTDEGVTFIDNERIFDGLPATETFIEARFPYAFVHYTEKGAAILAEHIAKIIFDLFEE